MYQGSPRPTTTTSWRPVVERAHHVLLALAVELPAEAARPRLAVDERVVAAVAPVAAARLEHALERLAVARRAQAPGLNGAAAEQAADQLVVEGDVGRRVVAGEDRDRERVLAPVGAAAQPARLDRADSDRLDRGRVAPQALGRLEEVEDAVLAVGVPVGRGGAGHSG